MDLNAFRGLLNSPALQEQFQAEARFGPRPRPSYEFNQQGLMSPIVSGPQEEAGMLMRQQSGDLMRENMFNGLGQFNPGGQTVGDFQNLLNRLEETSRIKAGMNEYGMTGQDYRNMGESLRRY